MDITEGMVGRVARLSKLRLGPLKNILRADEVEPSWDRAALLSCAPAGDGEYFLVPKAVD